jgi:hypothetical protein
MEETITALKEEARASLEGEPGERRAEALEVFLRELLQEYAAAFGVEQGALLAAWERRRTYQAASFYRRTNFPRVETVTVLDNMRDFKKRYPSGCFRCPACGGVSTNPVRCNSNLEIGEGEARRTCDGKSYGVDASGGQVMRVAFRDGFLDKPGVTEIFMPVELEGANHGAPPAWPT